MICLKNTLKRAEGINTCEELYQVPGRKTDW